MFTRPLTLLIPSLLLAAACGTGRIVPSTEPTTEPSSGPVASPGPGPTPKTITEPPPPAAAPAPSTAGYAPYGSSTVEIRRVGQFTQTSLSTPARLVIRDNDSWTRFWSSVSTGAPPSVDFSRDLVIAVAAGQRSSGGYSIAVQQVTRAGAGLAIQVVETLPAPGCSTPQVVTQPVDIVAVAAAGATTWSFSDQTVTRPCS